MNDESNILDAFTNEKIEEEKQQQQLTEQNNKSLSAIRSTNRNEDKIIYRCDKCNKTCNRKSDFKKHCRIHSGERPFKCNNCDKSYATSGSLKLHEKCSHTGERPYKCENCDKSFSNLTNYKNHKRIHTGEKPFKCNICSKEFTEHSTLYKHQSTHSNEKKYPCDICGNSYRQLSSLKYHKKNSHEVTMESNLLNPNDFIEKSILNNQINAINNKSEDDTSKQNNIHITSNKSNFSHDDSKLILLLNNGCNN